MSSIPGGAIKLALKCGFKRPSMGKYTHMGGTVNSLSPELRIRRSPAQLMLHIERAPAPAAREAAVFELMNSLLEREDEINEKTVGAIARAIGDRNKSVSTTADLGALMLAKDFPEKTLPVLLKEYAKAKGKASEKMLSTIQSLYTLSSLGERTRLQEMAGKRGIKLGFSIPESIKKPVKKAPEKKLLRRVA